MKPATLIQTLSFMLFAGLLYLAAFPVPPAIPVNALLRLDPLAALAAWLASGTSAEAFFPALLLVAMTMVMGRFFCGWVCPLGATIDCSDRCFFRSKRSEDKWEAWRPIKHQILTMVAASALLGLSLAFLVSPLAIATRFYGLLINGMLAAGTEHLLDLVRPLAQHFGWTVLIYADPPAPRFTLSWFTLGFTGALLAAGRYAPRFWCRYLCPAGALLALAAHRPLWRRSVSEACIDCGACQRACPTDSIGKDPRRTCHGECIACQSCVRICPTGAICFSWRPPSPPLTHLPDRRQAVAAAAAGVALAWIGATDPIRPGPRPQLPTTATGIIRPPGAVPETDFLQSCVGCGLCMKACPTNTLQPAGLAAGWTGFMSPRIVPRLGACEPRCNACGQVCPTAAILPLTPEEKIWAKIGTAFILRHKCLAHESDQPCLVCDEVCPYDAIHLHRIANRKAAIPLVEENRCSGCGLCHFHCPVRPASAIVVEPVGALRLSHGSHRQAARDAGLTLELQRSIPAPSQDTAGEGRPSGPPPGFTL